LGFELDILHVFKYQGSILVNVGDEVLEYQEVLILEAMKMENAIPSTEAGTVKEIKVQVNDKVATNQVLMVLE
jgi:biotin carboxyl carrier protein